MQQLELPFFDYATLLVARTLGIDPIHVTDNMIATFRIPVARNIATSTSLANVDMSVMETRTLAHYAQVGYWGRL